MSDELENKTVHVSGHGVQIDEKRSVFMGQADGDNSFYFRFINGESETRLRLSPEAAQALLTLLDDAFGAKQVLLKWILHVKESGALKNTDWSPV